MRLIYLLIILICLACSSIIKKPEIFSIHKIAVISVRSNRDLYNLSEARKATEFFSLPFLSKPNRRLSLQQKPQIPLEGSFRLVDYGLNTFEEELRKINGWQIVPAIKIVNSSAYKRLAKVLFGSSKRTLASTSTGLFTIDHPQAVLKRSEIFQAIKELMGDLGLDAVAFVEFDLAYAPNQSINTGPMGQEAFASVAASLKIIGPEGQLIVSTPEVQNGSGERYFSDASHPGLGQRMNFSDDIEALYKTAILKSVVALREKIIKEL